VGYDGGPGPSRLNPANLSDFGQAAQELTGGLPPTDVAQIFNLLYRGFATRRAPAPTSALEDSSALPIANRRSSRVQLCNSALRF